MCKQAWIQGHWEASSLFVVLFLHRQIVIKVLESDETSPAISRSLALSQMPVAMRPVARNA